jgi:hypothetical protein
MAGDAIPTVAQTAATQTAIRTSRRSRTPGKSISVTSGSTPPQPLPGDSSVFDVSRAGAPAEIVNLSQASSAPLAGPSAASGVGSLAGAAGETALGYVMHLNMLSKYSSNSFYWKPNLFRYGS